MHKKFLLLSISILTALVLSACAGNKDENATSKDTGTEEANHMSNHSTETEGMDHTNMNHSSSGELPEGLQVAKNPKFPVGSKAIIQANHMPGMNDAEATIVGAYDTTIYTVNYSPTSGGTTVNHHKWVIHEEIQDAGEPPLEKGTQVKLNADHMKGMMGALATIDSAEKTTVYMVDYTFTTGEKIKNHKWVTESELTAP